MIMAKKAAQKYTNSKAHEAKEAIPIEQILLQSQANLKDKLRDKLQDTYDKSKSKLSKSDIEAKKVARALTRESMKLKIKGSGVKKLKMI